MRSLAANARLAAPRFSEAPAPSPFIRSNPFRAARTLHIADITAVPEVVDGPIATAPPSPALACTDDADADSRIPDGAFVRALGDHFVSAGRPFAFVLNQAPATASNARTDDAARALGQLGDVAAPPICSRADHQDALALGLGVTERDPTGKAAREIRELWLWIKERLQ